MATQSNASTPPVVILRRPEVQARTGLSCSTIYDSIKAGTFPAPIKLGPKSVGWVESEINDFLVARVAARDAAKPVPSNIVERSQGRRGEVSK